MTARSMIRVATLVGIIAASQSTHAFFFIIPIPSLSKPAPLNALIDALEESEETKAVAYVSEDKLFGSKYWVWGHFSGHVPQAEADRIAMSRCSASLANAKTRTAGGKPLYDYGSKACELYSFANKTVSPRANELPPATAPAAAPTPVPVPASSSSTPSPEANPQPAAVAPSTAPASAPAETPQKASAGPSTPASGSGTQPLQPQSQAQGAAPQSPVAKKLRELEELRKEGLISEAEYQEKRRAVLAAM